MQTQKQSPALAGVPGFEKQTRDDYTRPPKKWARVLRAFLTGRSYNRFESERELSDHCLHSTVSGLQARGVSILRHGESVPGFAGLPTQVMRYQIDRAPENITRAIALLNAPAGPRRRDRATDIGEHQGAPDHAQEGR